MIGTISSGQVWARLSSMRSSRYSGASRKCPNCTRPDSRASGAGCYESSHTSCIIAFKRSGSRCSLICTAAAIHEYGRGVPNPEGLAKLTWSLSHPRSGSTTHPSYGDRTACRKQTVAPSVASPSPACEPRPGAWLPKMPRSRCEPPTTTSSDSARAASATRQWPRSPYEADERPTVVPQHQLG